MFLKNSSTLSFNLKKVIYSCSIVLLITYCGLKPLNYSEKKITIFFEFQKNPLNFSLVQELKKSFFLMNAKQAESKETADYVIEISNHRLGKFLEATDENFFPAVVSLDYQLLLNIFDNNKDSAYEIPIFTSGDFSYDTESILSNEKQAEEIKLDFFTEVVNELLIFFSEQNDAKST
tara:strand:+ start:840 stop:1370 length:531 start_codon:yes stop_codon:yes gene_type:complete